MIKERQTKNPLLTGDKKPRREGMEKAAKGSLGIGIMCNIIGSSSTALGEEKIFLSHQGTDCFLEFLELAAAEGERTDRQNDLIGFLRERREDNLTAPGTASFDVEELPWQKETLSDDTAWLLAEIKKAKTADIIGKLDYRPDPTIVFPWLDQFSAMIAKLDQDSF